MTAVHSNIPDTHTHTHTYSSSPSGHGEGPHRLTEHKHTQTHDTPSNIKHNKGFAGLQPREDGKIFGTERIIELKLLFEVSEADYSSL